MRHTLLLGILTLSILPKIVLAAVTINEIAWMGDSVSAYHEWIELYNDSESAVVVDGWTLNDEMNLAITLSGTISPLSYAVLERSSEESAPGTAFLLYTGTLVNSGATLRLVDNNGALQDQVAGGENWQGIGGNNETKETAQYSISGWYTAIPTPGGVNQTETTLTITNGETNVTNSGSSKTTTNNNKTSITKSDGKKDEITLTLLGNTLAYVNEAVDFSATLQLGTKDIKTTKYVWNFGDTNFDTGSKVTHRYRYPGTYVVTLKTKYDKEEQLARQNITVLPVTIALARNEQGDIQIQNNAQYEMDISDYKLVGTKTLLIPEDTIILPRGTITISRLKVEETSTRSLVALYDATMQVVAYDKSVVGSGVSEKTEGELRSNSPSVSAIATVSPKVSLVTKVKGDSKEILLSPPTPTLLETDDDQTKTIPPSEQDKRKQNWPYLTLVILLLLSLIIVWYSPKKQKQTSMLD